MQLHIQKFQVIKIPCWMWRGQNEEKGREQTMGSDGQGPNSHQEAAAIPSSGCRKDSP